MRPYYADRAALLLIVMSSCYYVIDFHEVMPDVITGVSLLLVFVSFNQWFGIPSERGFTTVWIAHSLLCTAYVAVVVGVRLNEMDPAMEEAALDLGATPFYAFTRITLPIISPSLFAGGLLAFSLSLDDLVIASFTTGPGGTTLPMAVFSSIRRGLSPEVNVIMTLFLAIVAIVSFAAWFMVRQKIKKPWG